MAALDDLLSSGIDPNNNPAAFLALLTAPTAGGSPAPAAGAVPPPVSPVGVGASVPPPPSTTDPLSPVTLARLRAATQPQQPFAGGGLGAGGIPDVTGQSRGAAFMSGLAGGLKTKNDQAIASQNYGNTQSAQNMDMLKSMFDMQNQQKQEDLATQNQAFNQAEEKRWHDIMTPMYQRFANSDNGTPAIPPEKLMDIYDKGLALAGLPTGEKYADAVADMQNNTPELYAKKMRVYDAYVFGATGEHPPVDETGTPMLFDAKGKVLGPAPKQPKPPEPPVDNRNAWQRIMPTAIGGEPAPTAAPTGTPAAANPPSSPQAVPPSAPPTGQTFVPAPGGNLVNPATGQTKMVPPPKPPSAETAAAAYLKAHPETAAQFDKTYGAGASAQILGSK